MIHWSTLQPSEIASLFILGTIFLLFVTVLAVIRSVERRTLGRVPLDAVKIDATVHPDLNNASSLGGSWQGQKGWNASLSAPAGQSPYRSAAA